MRHTAAGRKVDEATSTEQEPAMSTETTPDDTTPNDPTPDHAAGLPPRHRRRHGRTTVVLTGVVAAAVAGAVGFGQFDKPAAKTANAAASASTSASGISQSNGSPVSNADWSPYGGYGY